MFKDMYKQHDTHAELEERQEHRRRELLQEQRQKRNELHDENRLNLTEIVDNMEWYPHHHRRRSFKEIWGDTLGLQLSEWMREQPEKLCDWLVVPCPVGQRCLVVAHNGQTEMFNKTGRCLFSFKSMLPGGERIKSRSVTILDCVYVREVDRVYVLDVLAFGNQNFVDCDAQFRFFWLQSRFEEHDQLDQRNARNEKPLMLLKHYDFEYMPQVAEAFQTYPLWVNDKPPLDGFLFYHKEASYSCNATTPLVVWLFAFMVPDVLHMEVSDEYARPDDYATPLQYMDMFDERLARKRAKRTSVGVVTAEEALEMTDTMDLLETERELELKGSVDCT